MAPNYTKEIKPDSVRVLCVDDNHFVAEAVTAKLNSSPDCVCIGHLDTTEGLTEVIRDRSPSILLLDLDIPNSDPMKILSELSEGGSNCRVIIFSGFVRRELIDRAIDHGAWGYISKSDGEQALLDGIREVAAGQFAMSPEIRALCERDS